MHREPAVFGLGWIIYRHSGVIEHGGGDPLMLEASPTTEEFVLSWVVSAWT